MLKRIVVLVPILVGVVACSASSSEDESDDHAGSSQDALVGGCGADRLIAAAPEDRKAILQRAARWINNPVPYSQEASKDGHRTDCSGYVAMAWGRRDFTTMDVPPRSESTAVAHEIEWSDLTPGDAVARAPTIPGTDGHIMLYAGTDFLGFRCFWEQTHGGTTISSSLKVNVTAPPVVSEGYHAIRKN